MVCSHFSPLNIDLVMKKLGCLASSDRFVGARCLAESVASHTCWLTFPFLSLHLVPSAPERCHPLGIVDLGPRAFKKYFY